NRDVGEDRIRCEYTNIAPDLDRSPALVAEGEEVLPRVNLGPTDACFTGVSATNSRVEADRHADVEVQLARLGPEDQRARQQPGLDCLLFPSVAGGRSIASESSVNGDRLSVTGIPGGKAVHVAREREIPGAGLETDLRVRGRGAP